MRVPDESARRGLRTAGTKRPNLVAEIAAGVRGRVLTWFLALLLVCAATGCQWISGAPAKGSLGKLLNEEKNGDEAIKKAAVKDSSFPSANQPVPNSR